VARRSRSAPRDSLTVVLNDRQLRSREVEATAFREYLAADGDALARAAAGTLDRRVPGCPDWDVATLVDHVGRIHRWVAAMVRTSATERLDRDRMPSGPPGEDALLAWFAEGCRELTTVLIEAGDHTPVWNWSSEPRTSAFWHRRMAHETAVHRWDAESASTSPAPIAAELAADGIDELLGIFVPRLVEQSAAPIELGGSLAIECTDTAGVWGVHLAERTWELVRREAQGDASVRGNASDLLLFLYNRVPVDRVEVSGDVAVVRRWTAEVHW
jgi:uncharacterized protein (TIGR03083 family)